MRKLKTKEDLNINNVNIVRLDKPYNQLNVMLKLYNEGNVYYAEDITFFESKLLKAIGLEINKKDFLYEVE